MLPNASAGAAFHSGIATGKFHGVMSATTPSGRRERELQRAGGLRRNDLADRAHRFAGVVAEDRHAPADLASRLADRLSHFARDELRQLVGTRSRSRRPICRAVRRALGLSSARHAASDDAAERTARSTSSLVPAGTCATTSSAFEGLTSAIQRSESLARHSPPMKWRSLAGAVTGRRWRRPAAPTRAWPSRCAARGAIREATGRRRGCATA